MHRISARIIEGIGLQIANAELAEQLRQALSFSRHQAATDALTGLSNRRVLDELLATTGDAPLALLMLDLDHFKEINDRHGHAAGDAVLREFAERVRSQLRPNDVCARWGGEEFVVLLPCATLAQACEVGERLRQVVAAAPLADRIEATVSIGAAASQPGETAEALLARADAAVYAAKNAGRNRVVSEP
ncbi:MAG: GGDEF domain-containing protein [Paucibacter sp.]|nr:GGDEF domain-containing protein [Roseateles sp.]